LEFSAVISRLGEERKTMKASKFSDAQKAFILKQGQTGFLGRRSADRAGVS